MSPAVVIFSGPGRQTIAQGRNDRAKTARGDCFIFLDAECISRNLIGSLPRCFCNFGSILTWSHSPPICGCSQRRRLSATLVQGVANLGLWLKDNLFNRGESLGEFQTIRQEAFTRLGGFRADLVTIELADMFRRLSKIGKNYD